MSYQFQPKSCRFFLSNSFNKIINDQLQNLPFKPIKGVRLSFQSCTKECDKSVSVEIDSEGKISKLSVIDTETNSADMIFDFGRDVFLHYGECLDLICGHPAFHRVQYLAVAHSQAGHYSVTVTAL